MENIVITGYGIKAPNANNVSDFEDSMLNGNYELSHFESTTGKKIVVGQVDEKELGRFKNTRHAKVVQLALASAEEAINMAKIPTDGSMRVSVIFGSGSGPTEETVTANRCSLNGDLRGYPLLGISLVSYQSIASSVAGEFGFSDKVFTVVTGCNSSMDAIFMAKMLLDTNQTDICIVGSADAPICEPVIYGFTKLRMLDTSSVSTDYSVPFSGKNKFVMSEGSAVIVLEKDTTAEARKIEKHGILCGVESNNEGLGSYKGSNEIHFMKEVIEKSLKGKVPTYINSQALGLTSNDTLELNVRASIFGDSVPITSIKGITGHPFGATGMVQVISSLISIKRGFIPKTKTNEANETLSIVKDTSYQEIESVCITSHGFGGNNGCVVIGKVE